MAEINQINEPISVIAAYAWQYEKGNWGVRVKCPFPTIPQLLPGQKKPRKAQLADHYHIHGTDVWKPNIGSRAADCGQGSYEVVLDQQFTAKKKDGKRITKCSVCGQFGHNRRWHQLD